MAKVKSEDIQIGIYIDEKHAIPHLRSILQNSLIRSIDFIISRFQDIIIDPLILGSAKGWKPLVQTSSWRWLNSPKGYAQLGFSNPQEPLKLLNAIRSSWEAKKVVSVNPAKESMYIGINFRFADIDVLRKATIHPAAGHGKLPTGASWFDWIYAGVALTEQGFHFRKTGPAKGARSSAIAGPEAGLMKPGGLWQVTPRFRLDLDKLIQHNEEKIASTLEYWMQTIIANETRS